MPIDVRTARAARNRRLRSTLLAMVAMAASGAAPAATDGAPAAVEVNVQRLPRIGSVSDRFQSYTIEMLEVIGGKFWKPYDAPSIVAQGSSPATASRADMYAYRPPIDLDNRRLRLMARALGPAYLRVSGTWANSVYFAGPGETVARPPAGFTGVLTAAQWRKVIDFAHAVDASLVTSFAISDGTRDGKGLWTPQQARRLLDYTRAIGGRIAAAEFMNEPSMAGIGGAPKGYSAADYARDAGIFTKFMRAEAPGTMILGPGSATETPGPWGIPATLPGSIATEAMLQAGTPDIDAFSYHHYGAASQRCAAMHMPQTRLEDALSEQWLARTGQTRQFYAALRDRFTPGKPLWMTEGADAACGGNPWGGSFIDSFRYLDQLGRLARDGVDVVFHNTLAAGNYSLLDPETLKPKPNYWAALLWRRTMGRIVLDSGLPLREGLHAYAHCATGGRGAVAMLLINNDPTRPTFVRFGVPIVTYTLTQAGGSPFDVALNGRLLSLGKGDALPTLSGRRHGPGQLQLLPQSITFITTPTTQNPSCRS